jgi:hypothetical protein
METNNPNLSEGTSEKRHTANLRNCQNSSGPKTEPGKQASSKNAFKHGFFSEKALLPGESKEDYEIFYAQLFSDLSPRTPMEKHLVEQYIPLAWRIKRLPEIEAGAFARYGISIQGNSCGSAFALVANVQSDDILGKLARYEATLRKNAYKILELLKAFRKKDWAGSASLVIDASLADAAPEPAEKTNGSNSGDLKAGPVPIDESHSAPSFEA